MQANVAVALTGLVFGFLIGWLFARYRNGALQERSDALTKRLAETESELNSARRALAAAQAQITDGAQRYTQADTLRLAADERAQQLDRRLNDEESRHAVEVDQLRKQLDEVRRDLSAFSTASKIAEARAAGLDKELGTARDELAVRQVSLQQKHEEIRQLTDTAAGLRADLRAAREKLTEQHEWISAQSEHLKTAFSDLATTVVSEKTAAFKSESQESMTLLLTPLREQMLVFQTRMDQIHTEDSKGRAGLNQLMESLGRTHQSLAEKAQNLSEALTRKPKLQGDFGEMKLEAQLEAGGFTDGLHYLRQPTYRSALDEAKRPDVVIRMPARTGYLAVDAKVTLASWVRLVAATSDEERSLSQAQIIRCMRDRVDELAERRYPELMDGERPVPFTLMYVPIEGAALTALEHDPGLFAYAQRQKIIIASPSTLFVMVGIINQLWRVADQERNAKDIADEGGKLMGKLDNFLKNWESIGKSLENALATFRLGDGQLHTGRGNAMLILQRMVALGVQSREAGALERALGKAVDVTIALEPPPSSAPIIDIHQDTLLQVESGGG